MMLLVPRPLPGVGCCCRGGAPSPVAASLAPAAPRAPCAGSACRDSGRPRAAHGTRHASKQTEDRENVMRHEQVLVVENYQEIAESPTSMCPNVWTSGMTSRFLVLAVSCKIAISSRLHKTIL